MAYDHVEVVFGEPTEYTHIQPAARFDGELEGSSECVGRHAQVEVQLGEQAVLVTKCRMARDTNQ